MEVANLNTVHVLVEAAKDAALVQEAVAAVSANQVQLAKINLGALAAPTIDQLEAAHPIVVVTENAVVAEVTKNDK